ncbi:Bcr/CflA family efflux MFS transporter [Persicobacter diffluens]|uniref:Bicyclomycin/multidrug efflux system n=1 Tax=Persicobacter diffluens TaxID=981 RepID=A0AAN5AN38_9BACT|nr:bicyclomycin/multidrug efflux system [Persicobacter diffluens]
MQISRRGLIVLLSAMAALAPFAIDMYLPSIPQVAQHFGTSIAHIEVTISIFLIGFGIGQLVGGLFSDHYGRKPVVLIGLGTFMLASLGMIYAPSVKIMYLMRAIQAVGGGFVTVNSAAIVKDQFDKKDSAKILATVASIMMIAPMAAPMVGALIAKAGEWQLIFAFLVLYAGSLIFIMKFKVKESLTETKSLNLKKIIQGYLNIFKSRHGLGFMFSGALATAGMFTFITKSSSIYMDYFGASESIFPLLFGANVMTMIFLSRFSQRLIDRRSSQQIVRTGLYINLVAGSLLLLYTQWTPSPALAVIVGLNMAFIGSLGFVYGHIDSCFLTYYPKSTGTANSIFGVTRFSIGATTGAIVAWLGNDPIHSPFIVMFGCTALANLIFLFMTPGTKSKQIFQGILAKV